ncbi:hypothetical protein BgiMline_020165 [Biomphalaria glabrata]|nr:hypothetical protein BgiMline_029862 [Biomphalaria glabrata]
MGNKNETNKYRDLKDNGKIEEETTFELNDLCSLHTVDNKTNKSFDIHHLDKDYQENVWFHLFKSQAKRKFGVKIRKRTSEKSTSQKQEILNRPLRSTTAKYQRTVHKWKIANNNLKHSIKLSD